MRTNKLSEAITSSRQWTRECTDVSVHQHLTFSSLCPAGGRGMGGGGVSEPHHKLTVGSAVTRPTVPPWSSCSKNHPGLNWPSWSVFTHKNLHIWSEVLRYSNQIEGKFKYASLPNPRGNVPLMKAVYQEERKHSLRFNLLLLNDRIFFFFFCGEETFEIHITIFSSITPAAGYWKPQWRGKTNY